MYTLKPAYVKMQPSNTMPEEWLTKILEDTGPQFSNRMLVKVTLALLQISILSNTSESPGKF